MSLAGKLNFSELADLLNLVDARKISGILTLNFKDQIAAFVFEHGEIISAQSNRFSNRIGEVLIKSGVLLPEDLDRALEIQKQQIQSMRLGAILYYELGVDGKDIQKALRKQFKAILLDVLSWPEGSFCFDINKDSSKIDKFRVSASDFILEIGIEAGYIQKNETEDKIKAKVVIIDDDGLFARRCAGFLSENSMNACVYDDSVVFEPTDSHKVLLISSDIGEESTQIVNNIITDFANIKLLGYGPVGRKSSIKGLCGSACEYVSRPSDADLSGDKSIENFEVFMRHIQSAILTALES